MENTTLRGEALRLMDGGGTILDTARELSALLRAAEIAGAVIGGVAVVLHGHIRTTVDVDLFIPDGELGRFSEILAANGFRHDPERREFIRDLVPIHLVTLDQLQSAPRRISEIERVRTVSLADLIGMKLRSGTANLLRAQDLADVIGLARCHRLTGEFAGKLDKDVRPAFRKIVRAIVSELEGKS